MANKKGRAAVVKEARFQVVDPDNYYELGVPHPDPFREDSQAYAVSVWAYACVDKIASNFASIEYKAYRKDAKGKWMEFTKHPLTPLLNRPNAYMSGYDLRALTSMSLELTGNCFWGLERDKSGNVYEIWPLPSHAVKVVTSPTKFVDHYFLRVNGTEIEYLPSDMIHFKSPSPNSMQYGQGSVTAAKLALTQDFYAQQWNKYFFQNSARPDAVLESDSVMEPGARQRVRESWKGMFGQSGRGKTAILEGGLKYKEINRSQKDMDFIELRKFNREEILAAFGVPPVIVGVYEYANYANSKEQTQIFWKQTLIPKVRSFESILNLKSRQIFYDPLTIFQGDLSPVEALRVDEQQRALTAKLYVEIGVPANDVIAKLDLPFDPFIGGDISRPALPGLSPTGTQNPPPTPAAPDDAPVKSMVVKSTTPTDSKDTQWKRFDQAAADVEGPFASAMRGFFKGQKARVTKSFKDKAHAVIEAASGRRVRSAQDALDNLLKLEKEEKAMGDVAAKHIGRAYQIGGKRTAASIKRRKSFIKATHDNNDQNDDTGTSTAIDFDFTDPYAQAWLENKVLKLSKEANISTKEQLTDAIINSVHEAVSDGFNESETIDQIVDRINDVYSFADTTRAERIARTEVIGASNAGAVEAMRQAGTESKEWLSSRDEKVRDTHKALDGNVVSINEDFVSPSGETLNFPGDPNADPSEIVNCRCSAIPYVGRD